MKYLILVTLLMGMLLLAAGCNSPSASANSKPDPNSNYVKKGDSK
jgi:hypothetical protein